jgi:hypothetical protein
MAKKVGLGLIALGLERKKRAQNTSAPSTKKGHPMRVLFSVFPLLAIPVIIYNLIAFTGGTAAPIAGAANVAPLAATLSNPVLELTMISGVIWQLSGADALVLLAISLLFLEILKSTSTGTATIMNHAVSMILFIVCLVEFLLHPNFATSAFFIVMVMTLLDVLAGVVVTIVSARRDFGVGEGFAG